MNDLLLLFITGAGVGLMSSFFGIGGGVIMIPTLFSIYPSLPAHALIPISLGMIFLNTALNIFNWRKDKVLPSKKTVLNLFIGCAFGALLGSYTLYMMDSELIKKIFGVVLLMVSIRMLTTSSENLNSTPNLNPLFFILIGFSGAFLSSITGLGGGIIYIPLFIILTKISKNFISPYSNVAMFFASILGLIPHLLRPIDVTKLDIDSLLKGFFIGHMNIFIIGVMFLGAITTSKLGSRLNLNVSVKTKNLLLSLILLIFSIRIFIR